MHFSSALVKFQKAIKNLTIHLSLTACGPSSQCGYKEVCVQGVCRQACSTNQDDCPYPLTCLAGGVCGEACIAETDCLYGTVCHNNKCEVKVIVR